MISGLSTGEAIAHTRCEDLPVSPEAIERLPGVGDLWLSDVDEHTCMCMCIHTHEGNCLCYIEAILLNELSQ